MGEFEPRLLRAPLRINLLTARHRILIGATVGVPSSSGLAFIEGPAMFEIRRYHAGDAREAGMLIARVYSSFNLAEMTPEQRVAMLGPFAHADSATIEHGQALARTISAPSVWVAEQDDQIVGVLRGGRTDTRGRTVLSSLFVDGHHHRQGIGRALVNRFEREYLAAGTSVFKLASTLHAVGFYLSVGYRKSTGVRSMASFGERGLAYQPMKKTVDATSCMPNPQPATKATVTSP